MPTEDDFDFYEDCDDDYFDEFDPDYEEDEDDLVGLP